MVLWTVEPNCDLHLRPSATQKWCSPPQTVEGEGAKERNNTESTDHLLEGFPGPLINCRKTEQHFEGTKMSAFPPAVLAKRAVQKERARYLYRRSLKTILSWAVHRDLFYVEVGLSFDKLVLLTCAVSCPTSLRTACWLLRRQLDPCGVALDGLHSSDLLT